VDTEVSSEDFEVSLNKEDTKRVFGFLAKKYYRSMPIDEIESCQLIGLWKALKKYDIAKKRKFSNFLYVSIDWECKLYLRRNRRRYLTCDTFLGDSGDYELVELLDIVDSLSPRLKRVVKQRFFYNLTMEEIGDANDYSRETARRYLKEAMEQLQSHRNRIID
tara:strand:- start:214 stop:702 length:489 start_codon:yes stop_codon:yes gene_type:complete